jgi:hypothetical protein
MEPSNSYTHPLVLIILLCQYPLDLLASSLYYRSVTIISNNYIRRLRLRPNYIGGDQDYGLISMNEHQLENSNSKIGINL